MQKNKNGLFDMKSDRVRLLSILIFSDDHYYQFKWVCVTVYRMHCDSSETVVVFYSSIKIVFERTPHRANNEFCRFSTVSNSFYVLCDLGS